MSLTPLDKIKLVNHLDALMEAFVNEVRTKEATFPPAEHDGGSEDDQALLTEIEKQQVVTQLEAYRQALLRGNKLK